MAHFDEESATDPDRDDSERFFLQKWKMRNSKQKQSIRKCPTEED